MTITLCAVPYAYGVSFFYFDTLEEYQDKYKKQFDRYHCEEYEIQYIDGSDIAWLLWKACKEDMFKLLEIIEEGTITTKEDAIKLYVCTNINGDSLEQALDNYQDIYLYEGSMEDYAWEIFPWSQIPTWVHAFIDIHKYVNDMDCNGEIYQLDGDCEGYCVIR